MADHVHRYTTSLTWSGSTGVGYDHYDRSHRVAAAPATAVLDLAADPAFLGDPANLNPEQLLLAAAASCQLLSFLAVAARARLDVVAYADEATAVMPEADRPMRITHIDLAPVITLADDARDGGETGRERPTTERLARLVDIAHRECFIANSLSSTMAIAPTFIWR